MIFLLNLFGFWILVSVSAEKLTRCAQDPYFVSAIKDDDCSAECSSVCSPNHGFYKNGGLICYSKTATALMDNKIMESKGECVCIYEDKKGSKASFISCTTAIRLASLACVAYCQSFTIMHFSLDPNVMRFVGCESHLLNYKRKPLRGECGEEVIFTGKTRSGWKRDCHCGLPPPKVNAVKLITQKDKKNDRPKLPIEPEKFEQCMEPFPEYPTHTTNKAECDAECAQSTCNVSGYYHYSALICFHRQDNATMRIINREDNNQEYCECVREVRTKGKKSTFQRCQPLPYTKGLKKFRGNRQKGCQSWCDETVVYLAQPPTRRESNDDSNSIVTFCRARVPRGLPVIYPPITGFCLMRKNELKCVCGSVARKILSNSNKIITSEKGDEKSMELSPSKPNIRTSSEKLNIEKDPHGISPRFAENDKFIENPNHEGENSEIQASVEVGKKTIEITPLKINKRRSSEKRNIEITSRRTSPRFENAELTENAKIGECENFKLEASGEEGEKTMELTPLKTNKRPSSEKLTIEINPHGLLPRFAEKAKFIEHPNQEGEKSKIEASGEVGKKTMKITPSMKTNKRPSSEKRKIEITSRRTSPRFVENENVNENTKIEERENLKPEASGEVGKKAMEITPLSANKRPSEKREIKTTSCRNSPHIAENAKICEVDNSKTSTRNTSKVSKRKSTTPLRLDSDTLKKKSAAPPSDELIPQKSMDKRTAKHYKSDAQQSTRHDKCNLLFKSPQQQTVLQLETDTPCDSSTNSHSNFSEFQSLNGNQANNSFSIRKFTKNRESKKILETSNSEKNLTTGNLKNRRHERRYSNVYISKKNVKKLLDKSQAPKILRNPETSDFERKKLECSTSKSSKSPVPKKSHENQRCIDDHIPSIDLNSVEETYCIINENPVPSPTEVNENIIVPSILVPSKVYVIPDLNEVPPEYYLQSDFTSERRDKNKTINISSVSSDKSGSTSPNKSGSSVSFGRWITHQKLTHSVSKPSKRSNSSSCTNPQLNWTADGARRNNVGSSSDNIYKGVAGETPFKRGINNVEHRVKNHPGPVVELNDDDDEDETWLRLGQI